MGCTQLRRTLGQVDRRSADRVVRRRPCARPAHVRATSTPTGSARWARAPPGSRSRGPLRLELQAGHPAGEHVRHRLGGRCATPATRWPAARTTSPWPSGSRSSRTPASPGLVGDPGAGDGTRPETTAPARFSLLAPAYAKKYGVDQDEMKDVLTPHRLEEPLTTAPATRGASSARRCPWRRSAAPPPIAGMLGVFDCSGVSDGSAAAIVVRAEDAHRYTDKPLYVKGLSFVGGPGRGHHRPGVRLHDLPRGRRLGRGRLRPRPASSIRASEARHGRGARLLHPDRAGADGGPGLLATAGQAGRTSCPATFDLDGELPVNPDGGLKAFGHPIGASGLADDVRGLVAAAR